MAETAGFQRAFGNGPLVKVKEGVWAVEVRFILPVMPYNVFAFKRTMTVARLPDGDLALFNTARLNPEQEEEISKLGRVKHMLTLASAHGSDDPYFAAKYPEAMMWTPESLKTGTPPGVEVFHVPVGEGHADVMCFLAHLKLLITCDAVQNYPAGCSQSGGCRQGRGGDCLFPMLGFKGELTTPAMYFKETHSDRKAVKALFDDVMKLDFDTIVCGHGPPVATNAKAIWAKSISENKSFKGI